MRLQGLLPIIAGDPAVAELIADYPRTNKGHIFALPGIRPALLTLLDSSTNEGGAPAHDATPADAPTIVVCASGRDGEAYTRALRQFTDRVEFFPSWETLPHERLSPRSDTMAQRIAVMRRLRHPDNSQEHTSQPRIVVMPVRAFLQPVIADIADHEPLQLRLGDTLPMEDVTERLGALGYQHVDLVERRGQFATRGGIIDIFAPTDDHPIRIEFFGDEVDDIRYFSLSDQRTLADADHVWAGACQELLLTDKVRQRALELQPKLPGVKEMLERIHNGIPMEGMEALAPVLVDAMTSVPSMLPKGSRIIMIDPARVSSRVDDLLHTTEEFEQAAWEAAAAGAPLPMEKINAASFLTIDDAEEAALDNNCGWWDISQLAGDGEHTYRIETTQPPAYMGDIDKAVGDVREYARNGFSVIVATDGPGRAKRIASSLQEMDVPVALEEDTFELNRDRGKDVDRIVHVTAAAVDHGFIQPSVRVALFAERDLTGKAGASTREMRKLPARRKRSVVDPLTLKKGDYIVHQLHGVGKFIDLVSRTTGKGAQAVTRDYILIEYAPNRKGRPADRLYVPTDQLDAITKYTGADQPKLNKMGGADWARAKQRARKATKEIAAELIRLYAARQASKGFAFSPDTPWQRELEEAFSYIETPDQLTTIDEVKADMERPIPMDRLLCGDVGYGKTEVAVRAAFKAVQDGKQVAVLVPTTLLVQQHEETFSDRYAGFPVRVAALSRFTSPKRAEEIRAGIKDGSIDVVIGTHTLVTGQVRFKDLGLVIIDEEQRFGVEHKETLKALRTNVDVLAMSATPIPRTLEMAVTGIRDMSVLQTPPEERRPVLTYVGAYQDKQVVAAIKRELLRDGQVFYVHNRVEDIARVADHISHLVPDARVRIAHGKMGESALEQVMVDFWNHEFDVLVCTTIVETGLDIANANTLIVDNADKMGLSQMHQLRGRVGRGRERAYAYFLYSPKRTLTQTAHDRLETIAAHTDLGSGIAVAQKDLEIRGAGNLLGGEQSGHIAGVGFDLYIRMVAEAVEAYKGGGEDADSEAEIRIELPIDGHIPHDYISSERLRLETYGKLSAAVDDESLGHMRDELIDRYGPIPPNVELLFTISTLRQAAKKCGVTEIVKQGKYVRFSPVELRDSQSARLSRLHPGSVQKPAIRQILVPAPTADDLKKTPLHDQALAQWVMGILEHIITPFG